MSIDLLALLRHPRIRSLSSDALAVYLVLLRAVNNVGYVALKDVTTVRPLYPRLDYANAIERLVYSSLLEESTLGSGYFVSTPQALDDAAEIFASPERHWAEASLEAVSLAGKRLGELSAEEWSALLDTVANERGKQ